jgi:rhodanese-related sulfurtransferase
MLFAFTEIIAAQLTRLVGTPAPPPVLDVRLEEDVAALPVLVPGGRRAAHDDLPADMRLGRHALCVCAHGHRISHGAAAVLRAAGARAEALAGGMSA